MFGRNDSGQEQTPEEKRRQQMLLVIVGGIAVLAVLGVVFLFPMLSGSSDETTAMPVVQQHAKPKATAGASAAPTPSATPSLALDPASGTRDPFAPLPQEVAASTAATTATAPTTTSATTTDGSSTATTTTDPSATASPAAGSGTTSTTASGTTGTAATGTSTTTGTAATGSATSSQAAGKPVQYVANGSGGSAKVEIDSTPSTVQAGQTVNGYRVVSVSAGSIQVAHGSVTKTLALGELQTF